MSLPEPFARLVREHEAIAGVVAAARGASEAAVQYRDEALIPAMLGELRALHAFMGRELAAHIAREEDVLFPAFRALTADDRLIDELVVQHDRVRERRALLESVLTSLDQHHDDVTEERERLGARLEARPADLSWEALQELAESVRQLDWIFQGHFGDEEDDLFAPGAELFTPADLARMAQEMEAIGSDRPA
jgi:hypothetical protein